MALLRAGLWGDPCDTTLFPLSEKEWYGVYEVAQEQTVVGIAGHGLTRLPNEMLPPPKLIMKWVAHVDAIEQGNTRQVLALTSLLKLYRGAGIEPVLLKGLSAGSNYNRPSYRQSGDIDLYFPVPGDRERAEQLVREQGTGLVISADGSTSFSWEGVTIEHHGYLFDLQSRRALKIVSPLVQGIENLCVSLSFTNGASVKVLPPLHNMLLLNTHILKHAMGLGIGLRQFCDIAVAYRAYSAQGRGDELKALFKAMRLERWCSLLHSFLVQHLGVDSRWLPWESKYRDPECLMNIVQQGGNFGHYAPTYGRRLGAFTAKADTGIAFMRNARFCAVYAPGEALYTFWQLLIGQCRWR
jgi:hypothetical protein